MEAHLALTQEDEDRNLGAVPNQWFHSQAVKAAGCNPAILCSIQSGTSICRMMSDGSDTGLENRGQRELWGSTPPSGATSDRACSTAQPRLARRFRIRAPGLPLQIKANSFDLAGGVLSICALSPVGRAAESYSEGRGFKSLRTYQYARVAELEYAPD